MDRESIDVGRVRGVRSRSLTACRSTSREDTSMRISHEAIYQALYIQGRGALRRELTACLRTGRALRVPRERTRGRGKSFITPEILISERPAIVEDRAIPGHWEGDLILGLAQLRYWNVGRANDAVHDVAASAAASRAWAAATRKTRAGTCGTRRRGGTRRDHAGHGIAARAASTLIDVGSRCGDESARTACDRHRVEGVLLRPTKSLAAGDQREHQRTAEAVLPQRERISALTARAICTRWRLH